MAICSALLLLGCGNDTTTAPNTTTQGAAANTVTKTVTQTVTPPAPAAPAGTTYVDTDTGEREIAKAIEKSGVGDVTVSCPRVEQKKGNDFDCTASLPGGDTITVRVHQVDDNGRFQAEIPARVSNGTHPARTGRNRLGLLKDDEAPRGGAAGRSGIRMRAAGSGRRTRWSTAGRLLCLVAAISAAGEVGRGPRARARHRRRRPVRCGASRHARVTARSSRRG